MRRRFPRSVGTLLATGIAGVLVGVRMQWLLLSGAVWPGMSFDTRAGMHAGLGYGNPLDPLFLAGFLAALVALATPGRRRLTRGLVAGTLLVLAVMTSGRFLTQIQPPDEWTFYSDFVAMGLLALGVFGAFAAAHRARVTLAGLSLGLSGVGVAAVTVLHVLTVTGRDGVAGTPPLEFVLAPGVFVTLGGAALLVLAGTLVSRTGLRSPHPSSSSDTVGISSGASVQSGPFATVSVGVAPLALVCCGLVASVASVWFAWLSPEPAVLENPGWTAGKEAFVASFQPESPTASTWRAGPSAEKLLFLGGTVAGVSLAGVLARRSRTLAARCLLVTGALAGLTPLWRYDWSLYRQAELWSRQVPATGLALALAAGGLLVVAAALLYEEAEASSRRARSGSTPARSTWGVVAAAGSGFACVAFGAWFYWLVPLGNVTMPSPAAVPWLSGGPLGSRGPVLAVAALGTGVAIATTSLLDRDVLAGGLLVETGLVVCTLTCWRVLAVTGPDTVLLSTFYVGPGVTLTLLGGFFLVATGGITLGTAGGERYPASAARDDEAVGLTDEVLDGTDQAGGD